MHRFRIRRPSAGMTVGFVALVVALSGTAVALPGSNTVTSGDIKNGQVKKNDIRKGAVSSSKVLDGALRTKDFKASDLPLGTAYAEINGTAVTAEPARSRGIASANLKDGGTGAVCISGLAFTPRNVMATLSNFDVGEITASVSPNVGACPAGTQVRVQTYSSTGVPTDNMDFSVLVS